VEKIGRKLCQLAPSPLDESRLGKLRGKRVKKKG